MHNMHNRIFYKSLPAQMSSMGKYHCWSLKDNKLFNHQNKWGVYYWILEWVGSYMGHFFSYVCTFKLIWWNPVPGITLFQVQLPRKPQCAAGTSCPLLLRLGATTQISSAFRKSRTLPTLTSRLFMQLQPVQVCGERHTVTSARGRETHILASPTSVH